MKLADKNFKQCEKGLFNLIIIEIMTLFGINNAVTNFLQTNTFPNDFEQKSCCNVIFKDIKSIFLC